MIDPNIQKAEDFISLMEYLIEHNIKFSDLKP